MQSNMTASSTAAFATSLNFNASQNFNFLQQQQQQQQAQQASQIQPNLLNNAQFNVVNSTMLQQSQQSGSQTQSKDTTYTKIFVGGLPYHTTDESLGQFFKKFGNIEEAVVINDRQTGKSRGYGFVTMETKEAAEAAVSDPNPVIDGRKANVNLAYLGVKSRIVAPAGMIPLTFRCQLPVSQSAYGFHPVYFHPAQNTNTHTPHAQYLSTPNLLIPAQQGGNLISANANQSAGIFDLAYNTPHVQALNSNRTSPFENGMNTSNQGFSMPFPVNNTNHQTVNNLIGHTAQQSNIGYFAALPQHLNNVFPSHERL